MAMKRRILIKKIKTQYRKNLVRANKIIDKIRAWIKKLDKPGKGPFKIFTFSGLFLIAFILALGMFFVLFEKTGKIDNYFEKKYPQAPQKRIVYKTYRIGFTTDAHARFSKNSNAIIPESRKPMVHFVSMMNNDFKPDFVVDGGDFIDGSRRFGEKSINDFLKFEKILKNLTMPHYHVFGNHEIRGLSRETWAKINRQKKTYYSFEFDRLKVIILDSTLIPNFDEIGSTKDAAFEKQFGWLKDQLQSSDGFRKIVFIHHPPLPILSPVLSSEKLTALRDLFSEFGVRAVFSGHVEVPYHAEIGGVNYFVVPGFFRSEAKGVIFKNSFAEIRLGLRNTVEVFYTREDDSRYENFTMPSAGYAEIEKEIKEKVNFFKDEEY